MDDEIRDDELDETSKDTEEETLDLPDENGDLPESEEDEKVILDQFGLHDEEETF